MATKDEIRENEEARKALEKMDIVDTVAAVDTVEEKIEETVVEAAKEELPQEQKVIDEGKSEVVLLAETYKCSVEEVMSAIESGWKPKEEFHGDSDLWENPKRFLKTKAIIDSHVQKQEQEFNEFKNQFKQYKKHIDEVSKKQYNDELQKLKYSLELAKSKSDFTAYDNITDQIRTIESELKNLTPETVTESNSASKYDADMEGFFGDKLKDPAQLIKIKALQDELVAKYRNAGLTFDTLSAIMKEEGKKLFPELAEPSKITRPPAGGITTKPGGNVATSGTTDADLLKKLDANQLRQYNLFKKYYTVAEFIADERKAGRIKE